MASIGWHDRVVKIWRRGFIGGGNERFDPVYLGHPGTVTSFRWRGRPQTEEHAEVVLYTTCTDGTLRVWTITESHNLHILNLWAELDLITSIQPRTPLSPSPFKKRYAFIVDRWDFEQVVADASHLQLGGEREQHTREHLREIAANEPEVCIVLDDAGNMSAWGLERIGCKTRFAGAAINIGRGEDLGLEFPLGLDAQENFAIFRGFAGSGQSGALDIVAHFFDGRIQWLSCRIERLFDPSPQPRCVRLEAELTGHSGAIQRLVGDGSGECVASESETGEIIVWGQRDQSGPSVIRRNVFRPHSKCLDIQLIHGSDFALTLHENQLVCWDCRQWKAVCIAALPFAAKTGCSLGVSGDDSMHQVRILVTVDGGSVQDAVINILRQGIDMFLGSKATPWNDKPTTNGFVDGVRYPPNECTRASLRLVDANLVARIDANKSVELWERCAGQNSDKSRWMPAPRPSIATETDETIIFSRQHLASLNATRTELTIWSLLSGFCEYQFTFAGHESVTSVRWQRLDEQACCLTVILSHRVIILLPTRLCSSMRRLVWRKATEINLLEYTTNPIVDATLTSAGTLLVAAGNQLFGFETTSRPFEDVVPILEQAAAEKLPIRLGNLAQVARSSLPIFHPDHVAQQLYSGKLNEVQIVLGKLHETLRFWTEGEQLDPNLGDQDVQQENSARSNSIVNGGSEVYANQDTPGTDSTFTKEHTAALRERLESLRLPWLTLREQKSLSDLCAIVAEVSSYAHSADIFGLLYLTSLHFSTLTASSDYAQPSSYRSTVYALLSTSQDMLLSSTISAHSSFPWPTARSCHSPLWLSDRPALLEHFETIARAEYTKSEDRDPIDCSLFYLALRKKQVLQGLWRMAHGHKERAATLRMLAQDFSTGRWKSAALKNAYALLGKRRPQYAAAWFLLAGEGKSAANVIAGDEMKDLELAIAVARVFDGDDGQTLKGLIEERLLPKAVQEGDVWMAVYGLLMLKRDDLALQACVLPLRDVVPNAQDTNAPLGAKMWWKQEPSILTVYAHRRDSWMKNQANRSQPYPISAAQEKDAVKGIVRLYMRMGCGRLALNLLREWAFTHITVAPKRASEQERPQVLNNGNSSSEKTPKEPRSMLDAFETTPQQAAQNGFKGRKKVTEEPSAISILDNFDF